MADKKMNAKITVEFNAAASRQSLDSGDSIGTLFGKQQKINADLKPVAFSGSYNDLTGKPTVLTGGSQTVTSSADGGNNVFTLTKSDGTTAAFTVKNGSKGTKGDKGDKGDTGATGAQGLKGDKGDPGATGARGATGATGATGPQGPQGIQGPVGATGPQGPAGPGLLYTGTAAASAANCPAGAWYGQYS